MLDKINFTVYTYNAMEQILKLRDKVLKALKGKLKGYSLGGGTALSLFYLRHRESYDLDFFTKEFSRKEIEKIISGVSRSIGININLVSEQSIKGQAKILIYSAPVDEEKALKIDFIQDVYRTLEPPNVYNDIPVLSREDIYLRKIYAASGSVQAINGSGKKVFLGGRHEAKDFFDLYFLSYTFMRLSNFVTKYCDQTEKERIVIWQNTYDRFSIKSGILDIITDQKVDYNDIRKHFESEIEKIIQKDIE